jgi:hypothetical protein
MIPFHSVLPELAAREVRFIRIGKPADGLAEPALPPDEYAYLESYCPDLNCDCRRVLFQVIGKAQPSKIWATINYGWEKQAFYRKRLPWDPNAPRMIVSGSLDPINEQSEFAEEFLDLFQKFVLDEPYRLRLRRHYEIFREELARRDKGSGSAGPHSRS